MKAHSYLAGDAQVSDQSLLFLEHVLWREPSERARPSAPSSARSCSATRRRRRSLLYQAREIDEYVRRTWGNRGTALPGPHRGTHQAPQHPRPGRTDHREGIRFGASAGPGWKACWTRFRRFRNACWRACSGPAAPRRRSPLPCPPCPRTPTGSRATATTATPYGQLRRDAASLQELERAGQALIPHFPLAPPGRLLPAVQVQHRLRRGVGRASQRLRQPDPPDRAQRRRGEPHPAGADPAGQRPGPACARCSSARGS